MIEFFPVYDCALSERAKKLRFWLPLRELFPALLESRTIVHDKVALCPLYSMDLSHGDLRRQLQLGEKTKLLMDSTGYQRMTLKSIGQMPDPIQVLRYQEQNKTDLAMTLDVPFRPEVTSLSEGWRRIQLSMKYATMALKEKSQPAMRLYCVIHAWDYLSAKKVAEEAYQYGFDGYALGAPEPLHRQMGNSQYLERLSQLLVAVKETIGDRPLHLLGVGSLPALYLMGLIGVSSFDTLKYLHAAKYRAYLMPSGSIASVGLRSKGRRRLHDLPCSCPVCSNVDVDILSQDGSIPGALLALHNLLTMKSYVSTINSAIANNWFEDALERAVRLMPILRRPVRWIKHHRRPGEHNIREGS